MDVVQLPQCCCARRSADQACALRTVTSTNGMTADYYPFDHAFLGRVAAHIKRGTGD